MLSDGLPAYMSAGDKVSENVGAAQRLHLSKASAKLRRDVEVGSIEKCFACKRHTRFRQGERRYVAASWLG